MNGMFDGMFSMIFAMMFLLMSLIFVALKLAGVLIVSWWWILIPLTLVAVLVIAGSKPGAF